MFSMFSQLESKNYLLHLRTIPGWKRIQKKVKKKLRLDAPLYPALRDQERALPWWSTTKTEEQKEYHIAWNAWKRCCERVDSQSEHFKGIHDRFSETKSIVNHNSQSDGQNRRRPYISSQLWRNREDTKDNSISPWISQARTRPCDFDQVFKLQSLSKTVFIVNQPKKLHNPFLLNNTGDGTLPKAIPGGTGTRPIVVGVGFVYSWLATVTDGVCTQIHLTRMLNDVYHTTLAQVSARARHSILIPSMISGWLIRLFCRLFLASFLSSVSPSPCSSPPTSTCTLSWTSSSMWTTPRQTLPAPPPTEESCSLAKYTPPTMDTRWSLIQKIEGASKVMKTWQMLAPRARRQDNSREALHNIGVTKTEEDMEDVQQDVATCWDFGSWQDRAKGEREQVQVFETGGRTVSLQMKEWERRQYDQNQGFEPSLLCGCRVYFLPLCARISQCVGGSRSSNVLWLSAASASMGSAMQLFFRKPPRSEYTMLELADLPKKQIWH